MLPSRHIPRGVGVPTGQESDWKNQGGLLRKYTAQIYNLRNILARDKIAELSLSMNRQIIDLGSTPQDTISWSIHEITSSERVSTEELLEGGGIYKITPP